MRIRRGGTSVCLPNHSLSAFVSKLLLPQRHRGLHRCCSHTWHLNIPARPPCKPCMVFFCGGVSFLASTSRGSCWGQPQLQLREPCRPADRNAFCLAAPVPGNHMGQCPRRGQHDSTLQMWHDLIQGKSAFGSAHDRNLPLSYSMIKDNNLQFAVWFELIELVS